MSDINTKIIKILEGIGDEGVAIIRSELAVSKKGFIFYKSLKELEQNRYLGELDFNTVIIYFNNF